MVGFSAGGYGAMGLAIEHRDFFGCRRDPRCAAQPALFQLRRGLLEDFNPTTYRWKTHYDPKEVIGIYLCRPHGECALEKFMEPVFGQGDAVARQIMRTNPADLILSTDLQPGQLAIYVNYPGRDNFNFDAQAESFQWLAAQKGIEVTLVRDPGETHRLSYFRDNLRPAFYWLGQHLLPPASCLRQLPLPMAPR